MKAADFVCIECEIRVEQEFEDTQVIPVAINCPECGGRASRSYAALPSIVHRGKTGNAKNGYTSSVVSIKKS